METIHWSGYEWIRQERWGQIHEKKTWAWYDPSAVKIDKDGYLHLKTKRNPKYFENLKVISTTGIGLVSCVEKFGYGIFEIEAKLPQGKNLWPAFWMWSWDSWPPEIDVFEAYSNENGSYFNRNLDILWGNFWSCSSNVHLGKTPNNYSLGAKRHWMGWKDPSKRFIKYKVEWTEDKIEIYYDGLSVRKIEDKNILSQFNGKKMNVIINNSISKPYPKSSESDFIVKSFNYTQIK